MCLESTYNPYGQEKKMAEWMDEEKQQDVGEIEAVEQQAEEKPQPDEEIEDDLPEKLRGKSARDMAKMYLEAEKRMHSRDTELGDLRKLTDELLKSQIAATKPKVEEQVDEIDFFADPKEAVRRAVDSHPKVLQAEQFAVQTAQQQAMMTLAQKHPDFQQVVAAPEFSEWVNGSFMRKQAYDAANAFNVQAADELISEFKRHKQVTQVATNDAVKTVEKQAREKSLRSASVDTGGSGESGPKTYRWTDIRKMAMYDRAAYNEFADSGELARAVEEGRIK